MKDMRIDSFLVEVGGHVFCAVYTSSVTLFDVCRSTRCQVYCQKLNITELLIITFLLYVTVRDLALYFSKSIS
jgi:hypothetical protein